MLDCVEGFCAVVGEGAEEVSEGELLVCCQIGGRRVV